MCLRTYGKFELIVNASSKSSSLNPHTVVFGKFSLLEGFKEMRRDMLSEIMSYETRLVAGVDEYG